MSESPVRVWAETVTIPTYGVGEPDRNPMFLEKRVYQGSSGRVYPYPVIDKIHDERIDRQHRVVFLENQYLKLMVMPEYGGRIQYAYDKTNDYPFIYHNRVIKPALVGLAGPWLSGGIEFNWPQHHRPGTFAPIDWTITQNADGSQTLWLSEIEPMWHMKGTLGLTLYPAKAFLEINIRLYNRTELPQSFHLWTNPAVSVDENYQSVFPPDVQAVYDHGKRDVSSFPNSRGIYYKVDNNAGVDISWYKNLPVPTSYMAAASKYDFIGGYDHGRSAGVLHVADHHLVPGKKQWVWGCGDFGKAWDRNLTDEDGPYAELMCGAFADNQPDFSWLAPYEEKQVKQYFLPYKGIGYVRNATIDAAVSLEITGKTAMIGAYVTSRRDGLRITLKRGGDVVWEEVADLRPEKAFVRRVNVPGGAPEDYRAELTAAEGQLLVDYSVEPRQEAAVPNPAKVIPEPAALRTTETLYLAGLHLEQYRHATREPEDYYREALRRDRSDVRNNTALGVLLIRRGRFADAEPHLRSAIAALTKHNPNPWYGEPFYHLGVCLRHLGCNDAAYDAFYKATWNAGWQDAAFFQLAQLAAIKGELQKAIDFVERSLERNAVNQKATHLRTMLLRRIGRTAEAREAAAAALRRDPLDFGAMYEQVLLTDGPVRGGTHTRIEIACDYAAAGCYREAVELLELPGEVPAGLLNSRPMAAYFAGYFSLLAGDEPAAREHLRRARALPPERCFPNALEAIGALEAALRLDPSDARAAYYLGNLWYDKRQVGPAVACWEQARDADPKIPTVHRNLALAYFNKLRDPARALASMQTAFTLDPADARVLFELDLLRKRVKTPPQERLELLEQLRATVDTREDLLLEYITLLNYVGRHVEALQLLVNRRFHPWEGGEGKVTGQYVVALVELAKQDLCEGRAGAAVEKLQRARSYPENLGEGKLHGAQENDVLYHLGCAYERAAQRDGARRCWEEASRGMAEPAPALYYNDQNPETIFYQGLALRRLGEEQRARGRFETLVRFADAHQDDRPVIDYFAVSLPEFMVFDDDLAERNRINCHYLRALGRWGLGDSAGAMKELAEVLRMDPNLLPAELHRKWLAANQRL